MCNVCWWRGGNMQLSDRKLECSHLRGDCCIPEHQQLKEMYLRPLWKAMKRTDKEDLILFPVSLEKTLICVT